MLVYIRESDKEKIICNVDEKDIAEHLRVRLLVYITMRFNNVFMRKQCYAYLYYIMLQIRLKKEQEEKELKRKEKAEAHLYTIIKVTSKVLPPTTCSLFPHLCSLFEDLWEHHLTEEFTFWGF